MKKSHLFILIFSILLTSCNSFYKYDSQEDYFFLRKKYHITKIYDIEEDGFLADSYLTPRELNFDVDNTYMDFYYGGLNYFKKNGPKFLISIAFNDTKGSCDDNYLNQMNSIEPVIGNYKMDRKKGYVVSLYINFANASKHLLISDYNESESMYKLIAFPEYYIRLNFLLYLEGSKNSKKVCLEFGKISKVNELEDTPHL